MKTTNNINHFYGSFWTVQGKNMYSVDEDQATDEKRQDKCVFWYFSNNLKTHGKEKVNEKKEMRLAF
jgi:hypothetical protein